MYEGGEVHVRGLGAAVRDAVAEGIKNRRPGVGHCPGTHEHYGFGFASVEAAEVDHGGDGTKAGAGRMSVVRSLVPG